MLSRRQWLMGATAGVTGALLGSPVHASVSEALTLADLLRQSRHALLGTPVTQSSVWEVVGKRRRIVTYTVLRVDEPLDDRPSSASEVAVRTLGGRVGDIGQVVHGEARFVVGESASIFVESLASDVFAVTGMAQGAFPTLPDDTGARRLYMSSQVPALIRTRGAAVLELHGQTVANARARILQELSRGRR
jgi:hypothetical protein